MKLLDTAVFLYAQGRPHRYREPCLAVLAEARAQPEAYVVDSEALQELLYVYGRRGDREFGVHAVEEALVAFPDPLPITRREIEEGARIFRTYPQLSARDSVHAAVTLTHGLEGIVATDRGFDKVAGVTRFDPLDLAPA
ncbi:MAG TPA: type II toxin-antitoxin system VapC family toxin [Actinomycetota bacterium]